MASDDKTRADSDSTSRRRDDPCDRLPAAIERLRDIMAALRAPDGCPWDRAQTHASLKPYLLEEAYEVLEAIDAGDDDLLVDELGDLLFQVVFHARVAEERGAFRLADVADAIADKLTRRHPHVFGELDAADAAAVAEIWNAQKRAEGGGRLSDVPKALPAAARAQKLGARAAAVGFDWAGPSEVVAKVREELDELERAIAHRDSAQIEEELGDLLFAMTSLARHLSVSAEDALRAAGEKFARRFRHVERQAEAAGRPLHDRGDDRSDPPDPAWLDALWERAKADARGDAPSEGVSGDAPVDDTDRDVMSTKKDTKQRHRDA